jgi:hypothetical protein
MYNTEIFQNYFPVLSLQSSHKLIGVIILWPYGVPAQGHTGRQGYNPLWKYLPPGFAYPGYLNHFYTRDPFGSLVMSMDPFSEQCFLSVKMDDMDINKTDSDQKILKCDTVIYSLLLC